MITDLERQLRQREADGLYRRREVLDSPQGVEVTIGGRRLVNFCSNDYLGLASHPRMIEAMQRAVARYGVGSGASHLVCGHMSPHHALEEALAEYTGRERALLFSTGYQANLGVLGALCSRGEWVLEDRLNHASLLDGARLVGARMKRYPHRDAAAVAEWLEGRGRVSLIASDTVFSMDGDLAPLASLAECARQGGAWLYVDDAHGFGVLGHQGRGALEALALGPEDVPVYMATLGKALGVFGAFVAGSGDLIETLIQRARTYIFTTALPPAVAATCQTGLKLLQEEGWRRERLQSLIERFRGYGETLGLPLTASTTPIQPILVGDNRRAVEVSKRLWERGFWVAAIRPPTVPVGTARLRITLSAAHQEAQVDQLVEALGALV